MPTRDIIATGDLFSGAFLFFDYTRQKLWVQSPSEKQFWLLIWMLSRAKVLKFCQAFTRLQQSQLCTESWSGHRAAFAMLCTFSLGETFGPSNVSNHKKISITFHDYEAEKLNLRLMGEQILWQHRDWHPNCCHCSALAQALILCAFIAPPSVSLLLQHFRQRSFLTVFVKKYTSEVTFWRRGSISCCNSSKPTSVKVAN